VPGDHGSDEPLVRAGVEAAAGYPWPP
jgi:hypothetical protein